MLNDVQKKLFGGDEAKKIGKKQDTDH